MFSSSLEHRNVDHARVGTAAAFFGFLSWGHRAAIAVHFRTLRLALSLNDLDVCPFELRRLALFHLGGFRMLRR